MAKKPAKKPSRKAVKKAASKPAKKAAKKPAKKAAKKPEAMPKPAHGTFMWNELMTRDDVKAAEFYKSLIGWTQLDWPMGPGQPTYRLLQKKGVSVAGIMQMTEPQFPMQVPPHWMSYIAVDDVDKRFAMALSLGAEQVHPPSDIPNVGRFCIIKDPTGGLVSLMTPLGGTAK